MKLEQNESLLNHTSMRVSKRNAYHQAGCAVAIYLGNKRKKLPAVHFQILIKPVRFEKGNARPFSRITAKHAVRIDGGRLIENLPASYEVATKQLTPAQKQQCQDAFEADVVNLLAGCLAEAKYVALRDDEVFNANIVYLGALKFYGGSMDLELIDDYMTCLMPDDSARRQSRLSELFLEAYSFINERESWLVIAKLAETIVKNPQDVLTCEALIQSIETAQSDLIDIPLKVNAQPPISLTAY